MRLSATLPRVQNSHTAHSARPRTRVGAVSASRSNGTVNPPIPRPTPKRITTSCSTFPAKEDAMPNAETKATPMANAGSRPYLSANKPNSAHPTTSPPNTAAATVSSQNSSRCQSLVASTEMNDRRFTSMESAATHRPTKRNSRHWYHDQPSSSLSSSTVMLRAPPSPGFAAGDIAIAAPRSGPSFQARGVIVLS